MCSGVHTGERPYKCTWDGCNMAYTQAQNLQYHLKQHADGTFIPTEQVDGKCASAILAQYA
jgi:hypothetical protein